MEDKKNKRREGVSELSFSIEALLDEAERMRPSAVTLASLTTEQRQFILRCRDHERPVSYPNMARLWEKAGWGKVSTSSLQLWYSGHKSELKP